ncbi:MAG TPA: hypothetical protein VLA00_15920 [Xanthobacteraceae bacterium]|nr:hypothetical protein [Xanthobacteraceae bacterium]
MMQDVANLVGSGWLRARGAASSTARYWISVRRTAEGRTVARGSLQAEFATMSGGVAAGRATLILSNGEAVGVEFTRVGTSEAEFDIIGAIPGFGGA